jgi:hypothetical protein
MFVRSQVFEAATREGARCDTRPLLSRPNGASYVSPNIGGQCHDTYSGFDPLYASIVLGQSRPNRSRQPN